MSLASTRAVARLAWRTALRHPLRTTMIASLIGVAVMIAVGVAIVTRTTTPTSDEEITGEFGTGSLSVALYGHSDEAASWVDAELTRVIPDGNVVPIDRAYLPFGELIGTDLTNPILEGRFAVIEGGPPGDSEVALSWDYARSIDRTVGDLWSPPGSSQSFLVTATVVELRHGSPRFVLTSEKDFENILGTAEANRSSHWLAAGDIDSVAVSETINADWLAVVGSLPPSEFGTSDLSVQARYWWELHPPGQDGLDKQPSTLSTLVSAFLLAEIALLAAAAYATGIRRRLREIGLVAAQGATARQLRGSVVGEALITGLIGSIVGSALAIAVAFLARPYLQRAWYPTLTSVKVAPADIAGPVIVAVAAAVFAAWLPARTAARIPVLAALQGRMPVGRHPRWMVPTSLGLVGAGAFLLAVARATNEGLGQVQAIVGVIFVIIGGILIGAPLVTLVGRISHRFPVIGRVVIRDTARQPVRATAAIASLMVILIGAVAAATAMASNAAVLSVTGTGGSSGDPRVVHARGAYYDGEEPSDQLFESLTTQDEQDIAATLPHATRFEIQTLTGVPILASFVDGVSNNADELVFWERHYCFGDIATETCTSIDAIYLPPAVAPVEMFTHLGIQQAGDDLAGGTPILLGRSNEMVEVDYEGERIQVRMLDVDVNPWSMPLLYVPPDWAAERGLLSNAIRSVIFINDEPLTGAQRDAVWASDVNATIGLSGVGVSERETQAIIIATAAIIVAIVIAIVVALSATESDRDIATMVAVGAAPSIRRRFLGRQSGFYVASAATIAIPLGLLLMAIATGDRVMIGKYGVWEGGIAIPWTAVLGLLVVVPLIVGIGTGLLVRSLPARPPRRVA